MDPDMRMHWDTSNVIKHAKKHTSSVWCSFCFPYNFITLGSVALLLVAFGFIILPFSSYVVPNYSKLTNTMLRKNNKGKKQNNTRVKI